MSRETAGGIFYEQDRKLFKGAKNGYSCSAYRIDTCNGAHTARISEDRCAFLCIPIAIGATVLGPTAGLILGTLFGITSFVQCFGMDTFGTAMLSINWFYTFIICVVARALMGWFTGLIAKGLGKVFEGKTVGKFNLNDLIATILCPVMNTAFFLGFMAILFGSIEVMGLNVITAVVIPALSINCILEIIACFVVGSAVSIAVKKIVAANKSK